MSAINITGLTELAQNYQTELKMLPAYSLFEELGKMGIDVYPNVENEDIEKVHERKGGISAPYELGGTNNDTTEATKIVEKTLKVRTGFANVVDNVLNYKEKTLIRAGENIGRNQTYSAPYQVRLMMAQMLTFKEDILKVLFSAAYNVADKTPNGMFDSYEKLVLDGITDTEIAVAEGNQVLVNSFPMPVPATSTDLYTAHENMTAFLDGVDDFLLQETMPYLKLPILVYRAVLRSFRYVTDNNKATSEEMKAWFDDEFGTQITWQPIRQLGTGNRLLLHADEFDGKSVLDFGMNLQSDVDFVTLKQVNADPNQFNMWIQSEQGCRIRSFNKKVFCTNNGTVTGVPAMSGDYQ